MLRCTKLVKRLIVRIGMLLVTASALLAGDTSLQPDCTSYPRAAAIFLGTVLDDKPVDPQASSRFRARYRFRLDENLKGIKGKTG